MPSETNSAARIIVLMGVAGCGKSSVGTVLGGREGVPYLDGDDFHPPENVEKMRAGTPLTDVDRWPWLDTLAKALIATVQINGQVFTACSALKRTYRDYLTQAAGEPVLFVHLSGSRELIAERMNAREGHYMPPALLDSQFAALEPPEPDELACSVLIEGSVDEIAELVIREMQASPGS